MTQGATVVVSDTHLGAIPLSNERAFRAFLAALPGQADDLIINGDLFDFWFEYRSVILRRHFATLRCLAELVERDVRVRLVGGNHDAWGGDFLRRQIGVELLGGETVLEIRGRRTLLAHGDGLGPGDRGYRLLKRLTRARAGTAAFRLLHPDLATRIAARFSSTAARHAHGPGSEEERAERLSAHALRLLAGDPELELVIFGHSHRPELREVDAGRYYLNPGDWIHHCTYGVITADSVRLRRWDPGRPSPGAGSVHP
ncbi:MAG: UDP-2,3-diacylglucosamine diphosphatase [Gemmatimonadota bacterium]